MPGDITLEQSGRPAWGSLVVEDWFSDENHTVFALNSEDWEREEAFAGPVVSVSSESEPQDDAFEGQRQCETET